VETAEALSDQRKFLWVRKNMTAANRHAADLEVRLKSDATEAFQKLALRAMALEKFSYAARDKFALDWGRLSQVYVPPAPSRELQEVRDAIARLRFEADSAREIIGRAGWTVQNDAARAAALQRLEEINNQIGEKRSALEKLEAAYADEHGVAAPLQ
jgi:hypothetical protein